MVTIRDDHDRCWLDIGKPSLLMTLTDTGPDTSHIPDRPVFGDLTVTSPTDSAVTDHSIRSFICLTTFRIHSGDLVTSMPINLGQSIPSILLILEIHSTSFHSGDPIPTGRHSVEIHYSIHSRCWLVVFVVIPDPTMLMKFVVDSGKFVDRFNLTVFDCIVGDDRSVFIRHSSVYSPTFIRPFRCSSPVDLLIQFVTGDLTSIPTFVDIQAPTFPLTHSIPSHSRDSLRPFDPDHDPYRWPFVDVDHFDTTFIRHYRYVRCDLVVGAVWEISVWPSLIWCIQVQAEEPIIPVLIILEPFWSFIYSISKHCCRYSFNRRPIPIRWWPVILISRCRWPGKSDFDSLLRRQSTDHCWPTALTRWLPSHSFIDTRCWQYLSCYWFDDIIIVQYSVLCDNIEAHLLLLKLILTVIIVIVVDDPSDIIHCWQYWYCCVIDTTCWQTIIQRWPYIPVAIHWYVTWWPRCYSVFGDDDPVDRWLLLIIRWPIRWRWLF